MIRPLSLKGRTQDLYPTLASFIYAGVQGRPDQGRPVIKLPKPLSALWLLAGCVFASGCTPHTDLKEKVVVITGASSGFGKGVGRKRALM